MQVALEVDLRPIRSALREAGELVSQLFAPPETLQIIRERLFGSRNNLNEFIAVHTKISTADGTKRMWIVYEPSRRLLEIVVAFRAGEYEFLINDHDAFSNAEIVSPDI